MCVGGVCVRAGALGGCSFCLCLELQAQADLVAAGVDVLAVEESGQSQLDSCRKAHVRSGQPSRLQRGPLAIVDL